MWHKRRGVSLTLGEMTTSLPVIPPNIELYFTRHAESMENKGDYVTVDSPLSSHGKIQATLLFGNFDYVISSPMRRCLETLHYSEVTWNNPINIDHSFRERIFVESSRLPLEHGIMWETTQDFEKRVQKFNDNLALIFSSLQQSGDSRTWRVLLVGHQYFFNYWLGRDVMSPVDNAKIIPVNLTASQSHHTGLGERLSHLLHDHKPSSS